MIWQIRLILLIILAIWIIEYLDNKKVILVLPYLLMIYFTPIYNILEREIFLKIFGCGCVPSAQKNMLNIGFNANDLRLLVYSILVVVITILSLFLSKMIKSKKIKSIYVLTVLLFNILLAFIIRQLYMWA